MPYLPYAGGTWGYTTALPFWWEMKERPSAREGAWWRQRVEVGWCSISSKPHRDPPPPPHERRGCCNRYCDPSRAGTSHNSISLQLDRPRKKIYILALTKNLVLFLRIETSNQLELASCRELPHFCPVMKDVVLEKNAEFRFWRKHRFCCSVYRWFSTWSFRMMHYHAILHKTYKYTHSTLECL